MNTVKKQNRNLIIGIKTLFRAMPVITYSGTLVIINGALAWDHGADYIKAAPLLLLGMFVINGFMAHSLNDIQDWHTGTDKVSPGILSGGSKVLKRGLLLEKDLKVIAGIAVVLALAIALYLYSLRGPLVIAAVLAGMAITWAYTNPPLRLAYHPFLGELIGLGLSGLLISTTSYFVMTGAFSSKALLASAIQIFMLLGWIILHHIPDIGADLSASPVKLTTPAFFYRRWGRHSAKIPSVMYFLIAYVIGVWAGFYSDYIFLTMAASALICALVASVTKVDDIKDVTQKHLITTYVIILNSLAFSFMLLTLA
jgi:1,4-dihydroxy-2-naphthoate octaprenyltransferase